MKVEISEFDIDWSIMFNNEKELISAGLPSENFEIEHIGSTSVLDLKAKPIIDIMIGLIKLPKNISPIVSFLNSLNYQYIEKYNIIIPERRFFQKDIKEKRTFHLHMVELNTEIWDRHLFFRNQLRENTEIKKQYQNLKLELAKRDWNSQNEYAGAKSEFIKSIEKNRK